MIWNLQAWFFSPFSNPETTVMILFLIYIYLWFFRFVLSGFVKSGLNLECWYFYVIDPRPSRGIWVISTNVFYFLWFVLLRHHVMNLKWLVCICVHFFIYVIGSCCHGDGDPRNLLSYSESLFISVHCKCSSNGFSFFLLFQWGAYLLVVVYKLMYRLNCNKSYKTSFKMTKIKDSDFFIQ